MGRESGGSKTDTLIKLVLIFFITLLSFSVGTYVGKQFSDSQHKMAKLEDAGDDEKGERDLAAASEVSHEEALTDEDIANLTEEFVSKEKEQSGEHEQRAPAAQEGEYKAYPKAGKDDHKADKNEKAADHGKAAEHGKSTGRGKNEHAKATESKGHGDALDQNPPPMKTTGHGSAAGKAADRIAEGKAPIPPETAGRKPNSVYPSLAAGSVGKFTVQVASYGSEAEAQKHASQLKEKGVEAFYLSAEVNGKTWYRVNIGLFDNFKNAKSYREELLSESKVPSAIVQKIVR